MKHLSSGSISRQTGFSILEVLISMVVLSTGLLAVANLQVTALRGNQSAYLASLAAQQAQDMAERMNANPVGVSANQYDAVDTTIPAVPVDCQSATCTPAQLAVYDHSRWNTANQTLLPGGAGVVHHDAASGIFLIGVRWSDKQLAGANGWQAGSAAATVCGAPQANTRCFLLRHVA